LSLYSPYFSLQNAVVRFDHEVVGTGGESPGGFIVFTVPLDLAPGGP
jgi:hypothetical protein